MEIRLINYDSNEYAAMLGLRIDVLLHPIGIPASFIKREAEKSDFLIGAFHEGLIGCCALTPVTNSVLKLRQMAVTKEYQGAGIGAAIIRFAENLAKEKGYTEVMMHARDEVIAFYKKFGYTITGDPFREVGLPHHVMQKSL